ncbi:DUF896 domain-containing protein [Desulfuribacillus stibiiarsenatis]|uniref:DUF896 domain-containing protein n=1 Tax=Desulfuribacillus stibiiarsenatis TaxID=1390249 RepID=UPI0009F7423B|nr:DUF896 domain-containing protein [Desulfuribacillus stibiiarsenatis]
MITNEKIHRINELAKKSKECGLNREEKQEQLILRQEYILSVRKSLQANLDNIRLVD